MESNVDNLFFSGHSAHVTAYIAACCVQTYPALLGRGASAGAVRTGLQSIDTAWAKGEVPCVRQRRYCRVTSGVSSIRQGFGSVELVGITEVVMHVLRADIVLFASRRAHSNVPEALSVDRAENPGIWTSREGCLVGDCKGRYPNTGSSKCTGDDGPRGKQEPDPRRCSRLARTAWFSMMKTVSVRVLRRPDCKSGVQCHSVWLLAIILK